jgi:hypothetical protein
MATLWSNSIDETGTSMAMRQCVEVLIQRGDYEISVNKVQVARQLFSDCKTQKQIMRKINILIGDVK